MSGDIGTGYRAGEFLLSEKLGDRPSYRTWKAEHHEHIGTFAIVKIADDPRGMAALRRRSRIHAGMVHANIVRTISFTEDTRTAFWIEEYVPGRTLREYIRQDGIFPPLLALDTMIQVLEALEFASASGILHGHLTPDNILTAKVPVRIEQKTRSALLIKLSDFDLRVGDPPDTLPDDPHYQAPERTQTPARFDHRSDLYSAGVVFYEMITGTLPRGMDLPSELNPVIPARVDSIIKKALSVDPARRYSDARAMRNDILQAREHVSGLIHPSAPKPAPAVAGAERRTPRWVPWVLPAAVLIMTVGFLAGLPDILFRKDDPVIPPPQKFSLMLQTIPAGAEISIDEAPPFGVTPLQVSLPYPQSRAVSVKLSKKFHQEKKLFATSDGTSLVLRDENGKTMLTRGHRTLSGDPVRLPPISLERESAMVEISVQDGPPAGVYLDDHPRGQTPARLDRVEAGDHVLRVQWDKTVFVEERVTFLGRQNYYFRYTRPSGGSPAPTGSLQILTDPPGAEVFIDGTARGRTPLVLHQLPAGVRRITLTSKGFQTLDKELTITSQRTLTVEYPLVPARRTLEIKSTPPGADVYVDDRLAGQTPMTLNVTAEAHALRFEKAGYHRQEQKITDDIRHLFVTLEKAARPSLTVDCGIKGTPVFIDRRYAGKTPLTRDDLEAGPHTIRVMHIEKSATLDGKTKVDVNFSLAELEMVLIPAGEFRMGRDGGNADEGPQKTVTLDSYYLDVYEVTNAKYAPFLKYIQGSQDHSFCHPDEPPEKDHTPQFWNDDSLNKPGLPVVGVDWFDAIGFANWCGKRLPTEAEWEKAARGPDNFIYPWGQTWDPTLANFADSGRSDGFDAPAPAGSYKHKSPYGCHDMAGNVWERCSDWYSRDYYSKSPDRSPAGPPKGEHKVIRGGSWLTGEKFLTTSARHYEKLEYRSKDLGFRCAMQ